MSEAATPRRRSAWIPWAFAGGMATVVVVNAVLVYASVSTFTGVTVGRAYERGRGYDQVLAEARRQDALGWTATVGLAEGGLLVAVHDRDGRPVPGQVEGTLRRPLEREEHVLDFAATGPGRWMALPGALRPGQWEARLVLTGPEGRRLDIRERLIAP